MLIYVPSQSVQESEDLNSESRALQKLELSCTWKTKSRQSKSWLREWRKGYLTPLLSGLTLEPSEEKDFMVKWTSSLGDSLANPSQLQARDSEQMTQETCGQTLEESQKSSDIQLSFLKTSATSQSTTTTPSDLNYKRWVTELRKDYSLREKSAYHTVGNDYSCLHVSQTQTISNPTYYPTPTTQEIVHNDMSLTSTGRRQTKDKRDSHSLNLQDKVRLWRTASASDSQGGNEDYKRAEMEGKAPRIKLKLQATHKAMYPTPSASEHKARLQGNSQQSNGLTAKVKRGWPTPTASDTFTANLTSSQTSPGSLHSVTLPKAVKHWPTACARDYKGAFISQVKHMLPDAATRSDLHHPHSMTNSDGHTHSLTCQRLNPRFVEWLMGFPLGWSNGYECLEMESFHRWRQGVLQNL